MQHDLWLDKRGSSPQQIFIFIQFQTYLYYKRITNGEIDVKTRNIWLCYVELPFEASEIHWLNSEYHL